MAGILGGWLPQQSIGGYNASPGILGAQMQQPAGLQPVPGQQPMPGQGGFMQNNSAMLTAIAAGLLGGKNSGGGYNFGGAAQAGAFDQQNKQQRAQQNATMQWLEKQTDISPENKQFIAANPGLAGDIWKQKMLGGSGGNPTDDMREYQFAKTQGFTGSFQDWTIDQRKAGASSNNITVGGGKYGTIPPGQELVEGPQGAFLRDLPGGEQDKAAKAGSTASETKTVSQADKAGTMLDATRSIKKEIAESSMPATGTLSRPFALLSNTPAGRVRSYVGSLKSGVALQAVLKLKEASSTGATGFGALSAPELDLLVTDIGSLDADNTEPDIFLKTVDRIEARWNRILQDVQRTVPPERLAELGIDLDALRGGPGAGSAKPVFTSPSGVKVYSE